MSLLLMRVAAGNSARRMQGRVRINKAACVSTHPPIPDLSSNTRFHLPTPTRRVNRHAPGDISLARGIVTVAIASRATRACLSPRSPRGYPASIRAIGLDRSLLPAREISEGGKKALRDNEIEGHFLFSYRDPRDLFPTASRD